MHGRETEFMWDPIWFSPFAVLIHAEKIKNAATQKIKKTKEYRKIIESEAAAKMLVGMSLASKKEFFMQIVDDKLGSPDIKTICYSDNKHPTLDFLETQDVEVVEYEEHSTEDLIKFIERTKFSNKKAYDLNTHILCHLGKTTKIYLPGNKELNEQIARSNINCPVLFLGSPTDLPSSTYRLLQLWPTVRTIIEFDIKEEYKKSPKKFGVIRFERGKRKPRIKREGELHYPFEKLRFIPDKQGIYVF
jgi:hypothetical protein